MLQAVWVSSASSKPKFNVGVPTVVATGAAQMCMQNKNLFSTNLLLSKHGTVNHQLYIYIYIYIWYIGTVRPSIGNIMYSPLVVLSK